MATGGDSDSDLNDLAANSGLSSDSDEFSGFESDEGLHGAHVLAEINMVQSEKDRILPTDCEWNHEDVPHPLVALFTGASGIKVESITSDCEPIDIMKIFFPDAFISVLVAQTNLYAARNIIRQTPLSPHSRLRKWTPVNENELKRFFALIIAMGLTRKSNFDDYWSTEETILTPLFFKYMSKNRFLLILSNLDNEAQPNRDDPGYDPLYKVRPYMNLISDKFTSVYYPGQDRSMDEATCPFKGRVRFCVYNPKKPHKFGLKLYKVCESSSGYCVGFHVYNGKGDTVLSEFAELVDCPSDATQTTKIVTGLLAKAGLLGKGHHVFLDNYYNSPELANERVAHDTYMCGTRRTNRKNVPKVFSTVKKLKQGDGIFRRQENVLVVKFHDKRDVNLISTFHEAKLAVTDKKDAYGSPVVKPTIIVDYVQHMGGVDQSDQVIQYYSALHKTVKWSLKLFLHLFQLAIVNAFILAKKAGIHFSNKKRAHIQFRETVLKSLLDESSDLPLPPGKGRKVAPIGRLTERHFPVNIPQGTAKRRRPMRDCKCCNNASKDRQGFCRKQTSYMCENCNVPLYVPNCFRRYHTLQNFKNAVTDTDTSSDSE